MNRVIRLSIAVLTISIISGASQAADLLCNQVLTAPLELDVFSELEAFEEEVGRLYQLTLSQMISASTPEQDFSKILTQLEQRPFLVPLEHKAVEGLRVQPQEYDRVRSQLASIEAQILSAQFVPSDEETPALQGLQEVIEDLTAIAPETVYTVTDLEGHPIRVLFSQQVVKDLFLAPYDRKTDFLVKSLKLIERGVFGGSYRGTGLKRFVDYPDYLYIRVRGPNAAFRLMGYMHESVIHFVFWTNDSNHDSNSQKRFLTAMGSLRSTRGHNPH